VIGQRPAQDRHDQVVTTQDPTPYRLSVARGWIVEALGRPEEMRLPQQHSPSEHNVLKVPRIRVLQVLPTPVQPPQTTSLISFRAQLSPGNQSLAST